MELTIFSKVKVTSVDKYGFCGRDRHPDDKLIGEEGIIVASYIEYVGSDHCISSINEDDYNDVGAMMTEVLAGTQSSDYIFRVFEVYFPSRKETFTMMDFEVKEVA